MLERFLQWLFPYVPNHIAECEFDCRENCNSEKWRNCERRLDFNRSSPQTLRSSELKLVAGVDFGSKPGESVVVGFPAKVER
jgi:hypothetical protein